jgi:hypothetical protein
VGLAELRRKPDRAERTRLPVRQKGGGRNKISLKDPDLLRIRRAYWSLSRKEIRSRRCAGPARAYEISPGELRGGDQYLRWVASGLLWAESRWNRIHAWRELPILVKELELVVVKAIPVRHASVA